MENGKAALTRNLTNGIGRGSTEFFVLRPSERVLGEYIHHFVRQPRFREEAKNNFTGTAGQQRVPRAFMENALIPLPPLDEQRRIVGILNRAVRIERLRAQAQERLREFIPALFIKMFGDPVENPMGWVEPSLGVIANNCFRNGLSPSSNGLVGGEVLTLSAITCGWFDFSKRKSARFERAPSSSQMLSQKTFLICRGNGNKRLVGAGAFPDRESSCVCYPDTMIGVTVDPKIVAPAYLQYVWASQRVRSQIERAARTTNGTHKVDQRVLSAVVFPLPPIVLQRRFAKIVESTRSAATIGTSNSCDLTASLMSRLLDNAA